MPPLYAFQWNPMDLHHIHFRESGIKMHYLTWLEQYRPPKPTWLSAIRTPPHLLCASLESGANMLNSRKLSEFLTKNVDGHLLSTLFVMSPNGTLLAYSTPANIKDLRDEATVVSMAWKEHLSKNDAETHNVDSPTGGTVAAGVLETLTIQVEAKNVIAKAMQPKLLLVMIGGYTPGSKQEYKMVAEYKGEARFPPNEPVDPPADWSKLVENERDIKLGVLHVQRKKLDLLTQFVRSELESDNFVMPDDGQFK